MFSPVGLSRTCHSFMTASVRGSSSIERSINIHGIMIHVCRLDTSTLTFILSKISLVVSVVTILP